MADTRQTGDREFATLRPAQGGDANLKAQITECLMTERARDLQYPARPKPGTAEPVSPAVGVGAVVDVKS